MNNPIYSAMKCVATILSFPLIVSVATAQHTQEYQFNLKGDNIGFFDSGSTFETSTTYFDESISYGINNLMSDLGMGGTSPFDWRMELEIIDLNSIGLNCCDLGTIGWDFDMDFGLGAAMWMQHQVDGGTFSINYPMELSLSIPQFNRGDIITISLDSSYANAPTLGISNPVLSKDLKTSFEFEASSELDLYLGPFGDYDHTFFDIDQYYEATLLHVGPDGFSGDLGLAQNPALSLIPGCTNSWATADGYEYELDSDNDAYDGTYVSNLCSEIAPCLQEVVVADFSYDPMEEWYKWCQLRIPFADDFAENLLGTAVVPFLAPEPWYTTAPQLELDWPFGLGLTLDVPDDPIVENTPNWANGVLSAQTANAVPYFDLSHNYLDMLEDLLKFGAPYYPDTAPGPEDAATGPAPQGNNPYAYAALLAVDMRKSEDNAYLEDQDISDGEKISVWNFLTAQVPSISLPWGSFSLSDLSLFDFWIEYNILDLESHFTITNEFEVEYSPEVRVKLHFSEPVEYKTNPNAADWTLGSVIDVPIEGEFELKTTCDSYELQVVPEPYLVTSSSDMSNEGTDSYDTFLDVDALNFNVGVDGCDIIPAFTVDFLCVGSVGEFLNSLGSCALFVLEWVEGAWCCFKDFFGSWPWDWDWSCSDCWTSTNECETCNYGFQGLSLPSYDMAADVCSTSDAFQENGMCGFFWRIPFSSTEDNYATSNWLVDDVTFVDPDSDGTAFVGDSLTATAIPFQLYDVEPIGVATDFGFRNAVVELDRTGGVLPLTLHAEQLGVPTDSVWANPQLLNTGSGTAYNFASASANLDVSFEVSDGDRILAKPSVLENYSLQDANGCFADFVTPDVAFESFGADESDVTPAMRPIGIPYFLPTPEFCGDADDDGCNDCSSGVFDTSNDGADYDGDGICNLGDTDDDNDGVLDNEDSAPLNEFECSDVDNDGCDDCSSGTYDPANDGTDTNGDGVCDNGDNDIDGDGALNDNDSDDSDPNVCSDVDNDGCDDCVSGTFAPGNDGDDFDGDGLCNSGDPDIDNDSVANDADPDDYDAGICGDSDNDGCDDCNSGEFDPSNDGTDTDGDGVCDTEDDDIDGDGSLNENDSDDFNIFVCSDTDGDGCDDCQSGTYNPSNDGTDYDGDGLCNSGDPDIDGDGVLNEDDNYDFNPNACDDTDGDGCDDCLNGSLDPSNDGPDLDGDGLCNSGDSDQDGDGVEDFVFNTSTNALIPLDSDATDPNSCLDTDGDGCDDCSQTGDYTVSVKYFQYLMSNHINGQTLIDTVEVVLNDGTDTDGDGFCDGTDAFPSDASEYADNDGDGVGLFQDCNDSDPSVGAPSLVYYTDSDGDGYGDATSPAFYFCEEPCAECGMATSNNDCNDANALIYPGADEVCDGVDNDCDDVVDEDPTDGDTYYADLDGDTYGDPNSSITACTQPTGYVTNNTDCDDLSATTYPTADEICGDNADNNCDGSIDENCIVSFSYTGAVQTYTVPANVTSISVDAFGASGMTATSNPNYGGNTGLGKGGRVQADLAVTPGETLYIYVGGTSHMSGVYNHAGGWNGGGAGSSSSMIGAGWPGGGATDLRMGGTDLSDRVIVAGGGGGRGDNGATGGHGGGLVGQNGGGGNTPEGQPAYGAGGSQIEGGVGGYAWYGDGTATYSIPAGANGTVGNGGSAFNHIYSGGGGGGYYGGGAGAEAGGGGGSSYTDPALCSNVIHTQGAQVGPGTLIITPN